jgi:hypothetical protein
MRLYHFINWEATTSVNKKDLEQDALNLCKNKTTLQKKNSQLEEGLQVLMTEKKVMRPSMGSCRRSWRCLRPCCCSPRARWGKYWHRFHPERG